MSDSRSYFADLEAEAYERQHGERDRRAGRQLAELRLMPAGLFYVTDLMFLFNPAPSKWTRWDEATTRRVAQLHAERLGEGRQAP